MKKALLFGSAAVLTLALVGGGLALADGPRHGGGHGGMGMHDMGGMGMHDMGPMGMLERFDRSGDGRVSQEDVDAVRAERHAAFDADGDGALSLDEYQALWLDAMRPRMVRAFQQHDADGDAAVTVDEFAARFAGMVARMDQDGDGVVTEAEMRQRMRQRHDQRQEGRDGRGGDRDGEGRGQRDSDR